VIPSVAYTDPEVARMGVTKNEAKAASVKYRKGVFPWVASCRSLTLGRDEASPRSYSTNRSIGIIGCGIVGPNAGDLIAEAALGIEMGSDAGLTIHPHPTLSEWAPSPTCICPIKKKRRLSKEIQNARISHRRGR
jgi:dihydrolipoamide dehydrogenase